MDIVSRSEWGAKPAESVTPWNVADLLGITYHHFAIPRAADNHSKCDDQMRSVQATHQAGEFTDIAYNFCVCVHGVVFEARGWDRQTGANGTIFANQHYMAVSFMGDSDADGFPEKAQNASAALFARGFKKGINREVVPHRKRTATECPGDKAHAWVVDGKWKADLPPIKTVRYELWDDAKKVTQSAKVPLTDSKAKLETFLDARVGAIHKRLLEEGKVGGVRIVRRVFS